MNYPFFTPSGDRSDVREPDGFRLHYRIAVGKRSQWFEAEQIRLARKVAIKFLHPELAGVDGLAEAFIDAGRQAATLVHPAALNIINVHLPERCIVMQWCGGKSLSETPAILHPAAAALVGAAVMDCLSSLHATGRSHGNLTPGNIFLDNAGKVWLGDFFHPPILDCNPPMLIGDSRFIAPEVLAGGEPDWLSDAYGLASAISFALSSEIEAPGLQELLNRMRFPQPRERGENPEQVRDVFLRLHQAEKEKAGLARSDSRGKRLYRRVPAKFDVSLVRRSASPGETAVILEKTRDIGESGVFVETEDELICVGSILELEFSLKGVEGDFHAFGIVRWRSAPPLPPGVGIQFVEVDEASVLRLRRFLDNA